MIQLLHTPAGVRDYYNGECVRKQTLANQARECFRLFGYAEIQTPVFEYFDIFNAERGSVPSRFMYKLFDREGETLVLRPDYTPAIARCASKYFGNVNLPLRLSYVGNVYVDNPGYRGQLKESSQAGVELVGDGSVAGNAELLAMTVRYLQMVGLSRFQIEVGDVRYFKGLMEQTGVSREVEEQIRTCIENKNHFGLEEILEENQISEQISQALGRLPQMFGDPREILKEARELTTNPEAIHAVERLEELYHYMELYGMSQYITFDLGMLGTHNYYTGIIFKGYTYGTGDSIVTGGRYDNLLEQFGKKAPAIGFAIKLDVLMQALNSQHIEIAGRLAGTLILYAGERTPEAIRLAEECRGRGEAVSLLNSDLSDLRELQEYIQENHITKVIEMPAGTSDMEVTEQ